MYIYICIYSVMTLCTAYNMYMFLYVYMYIVYIYCVYTILYYLYIYIARGIDNCIIDLMAPGSCPVLCWNASRSVSSVESQPQKRIRRPDFCEVLAQDLFFPGGLKSPAFSFHSVHLLFVGKLPIRQMNIAPENQHGN